MGGVVPSRLAASAVEIPSATLGKIVQLLSNFALLPEYTEK